MKCRGISNKYPFYQYLAQDSDPGPAHTCIVSGSKSVLNIATISELYYLAGLRIGFAQAPSRITGNGRLGTRSRFASRAALPRLRCRAGSRSRLRPRQARHAVVAPARHGAAARAPRRYDFEGLCGGRAAWVDYVG